MSQSKEPRIFLGDRGFLKRYQTPYGKEEIISVFRSVVRSSGLGLSSSDLDSANAASKALVLESPYKHIYHSRFFIKVGKAREQFYTTEQVQENLNVFYQSSGLIFSPLQSLMLEDLNLINTYKPGIISIGGDWLDILIAQGKHHLIDQILDSFRRRIKHDATLILMSFKMSSYMHELIKREWVGGLAIPINLLNIGDLEYSRYVELIRKVKPIWGLHCLAGGVIPILPALDYALNHVGVRSCIVGATSIDHIEKLVSVSCDF